jgi:DNA-directed RNA polymerase sigma subunit (sigma70/sigma32)
MLALIFAVDHFDALRKNRFITYAYYGSAGG